MAFSYAYIECMTESDATSISYPTRRRSRACNGRSWQATSTRRIGLCHIPGTLRPRSRSIPFSRGLPLFCFCTGWDYCAGRAVVSKSRARLLRVRQITQIARERQAYTKREQFPTRHDKAVRAQSIRGRMELGGLSVPTRAPTGAAGRSLTRCLTGY